MAVLLGLVVEVLEDVAPEDDELEQAFSGKKSAQAALDSAVERGNRLLRQFERANP